MSCHLHYGSKLWLVCFVYGVTAACCPVGVGRLVAKIIVFVFETIQQMMLSSPSSLLGLCATANSNLPLAHPGMASARVISPETLPDD